MLSAAKSRFIGTEYCILDTVLNTIYRILSEAKLERSGSPDPSGTRFIGTDLNKQTQS
jgi:hypothetical protein